MLHSLQREQTNLSSHEHKGTSLKPLTIPRPAETDYECVRLQAGSCVVHVGAIAMAKAGGKTFLRVWGPARSGS